MSSQIYAIENAKHVIICFGHQKNRGSISKNIAHTSSSSSSSDRDGGGNTSDQYPEEAPLKPVNIEFQLHHKRNNNWWRSSIDLF
jgi:hypothetical protein